MVKTSGWAGKDFGMNLVYLSLSQLDVILGMNLLDFNHVYINFFDKTILFLVTEESGGPRFMFAGQVEMSLREDDQVFVMFASLRMENDVLLMICR